MDNFVVFEPILMIVFCWKKVYLLLISKVVCDKEIRVDDDRTLEKSFNNRKDDYWVFFCYNAVNKKKNFMTFVTNTIFYHKNVPNFINKYFFTD